MASKRTTVIIVGGGVAGLTLANMMEQTGFDYLLLEKHSQIAADVGAGILILAPGARILDQLGCYGRLRSLVPPEHDCGPMNVFGPAGEEISIRMRFEEMLVTRLVGDHIEREAKLMFCSYGYGMTFVDRHMLMQVLYSNLKDKSKVLANKDVVAVEQSSNGVEVLTADGHRIFGEWLVGADGIHSAIRREMWKAADKVNPDYFSQIDRTGVCSEYCCIFGVSNPIPLKPLRSINHTMGENYSWVAMNGPEGRIYWFLFSRLSSKIRGLYERIPRYNETDMDILVRGHLKDRVAENLHFEELWNARRAATMSVIPEHVFSRWSHGRITTLGDAAHKFSPIGASAGNSAIETCAALTNFLYQLKMSKPMGTSFSEKELDSVFRQTQAVRQSRVKTLMERSHIMHKLMSRDSLLTRSVVKYILPLVGDAPLVTFLLGLCTPHVYLEMKPLPIRPHIKPHNQRSRNVLASWYAVAAVVAIMLSSLMIVALQPAAVLMVRADNDRFIDWLISISTLRFD